MSNKPRIKIIGIIGVGEPTNMERELAYKLGQKIAEKGFTLVCGGLGGVMFDASRGASEKKGVVIGILPGDKKQEANPHVTYPIVTNLGHARNIVIAHTADVLIAIGKGYGTLSEMAIGLKIGKKVVSLKSWDIEGTIQVVSVDEAIKQIR